MKNKKQFIIVFFATMMVLFPLPNATGLASSPTIENHWAEPNVEFLHERGVLDEGEVKAFEPDLPISRAEMASLINRALGYKERVDSIFADVDPQAPYAEDISIAAARGYLKGIGNNLMGPEAMVSREQAAVIVGRLRNLKELQSTSSFKDVALCSDWARSMTGTVVQKGYMVGFDGTFRPKDLLTRAEAAAIISRLVFIEVQTTRYDIPYLQQLDGGFVDTISRYAGEEGMTVEAFRVLCEKSAAEMTVEELAMMNRIREKQLKPTAGTLMQKVITTYDMNKYLSGAYRTPKGFISICADVKQYDSIQEFFNGLRLDYAGTYFKPDEGSYAVIRFKAANIEKAFVPKLVMNGGTFQDPYPFGGAGFTTGTGGTWGSPEWVMPEFTVLYDGAQLFEIFQDGTEVLRGVYKAEPGRFISLD